MSIVSFKYATITSFCSKFVNFSSAANGVNNLKNPSLAVGSNDDVSRIGLFKLKVYFQAIRRPF